ncbi:hypothetical protein AMECASPLE_010791 [Ameca splendens]|uniref:Uncharacterized protein n=1 Tax=Ameca splendens TaxID=208324 RepID=A0ABV0ZKT8_9TELE
MPIIHTNPPAPVSHPSKCPLAINHPSFPLTKKKLLSPQFVTTSAVARTSVIRPSKPFTALQNKIKDSQIEDADQLHNISPVKRSGFRLKTFSSSPCPRGFLPVLLGFMRLSLWSVPLLSVSALVSSYSSHISRLPNQAHFSSLFPYFWIQDSSLQFLL